MRWCVCGSRRRCGVSGGRRKERERVQTEASEVRLGTVSISRALPRAIPHPFAMRLRTLSIFRALPRAIPPPCRASHVEGGAPGNVGGGAPGNVEGGAPGIVGGGAPGIVGGGAPGFLVVRGFIAGDLRRAVR